MTAKPLTIAINRMGRMSKAGERSIVKSKILEAESQHGRGITAKRFVVDQLVFFFRP